MFHALKSIISSVHRFCKGRFASTATLSPLKHICYRKMPQINIGVLAMDHMTMLSGESVACKINITDSAFPHFIVLVLQPTLCCCGSCCTAPTWPEMASYKLK